MTEDAPTDLLTELRERSRRQATCAVCDWLATRDDADEWDAAMRLPWQEINAKAIWEAMAARGFDKGDKTVQGHRAKGHRVPA